MERNAWAVVDEVTKRVDDAPVLSEYIRAYRSEKMDNLFFFTKEHLSSYQKLSSEDSRKEIP